MPKNRKSPVYIGFSKSGGILIAMKSIHGKIKALIVLGLGSALVSFFGLPPNIEAWVLFVLGVILSFIAWRVHGSIDGDIHEARIDNASV